MNELIFVCRQEKISGGFHALPSILFNHASKPFDFSNAVEKRTMIEHISKSISYPSHL
jgi:hypothetical protein